MAERYEAFLDEQAYISNTYTPLVTAAKAAYETAKAALVLDLFGPETSSA
jgi:hypothetical protein